jgi:hypothetical protein
VFPVPVGVRDIPETPVAFRANPTLFPLSFNLTSFFPSSPPPLLSSYPFLYLYIKMADVKKGKSPKEFAGMLVRLCLILQSR